MYNSSLLDGTNHNVALRLQLTRILLKLYNKSDDMRKSTVIESINGLPDEFSIDEIIERLIVLEKIEKGRQQIEDGKTVPHEQVSKIIKKW